MSEIGIADLQNALMTLKQEHELQLNRLRIAMSQKLDLSQQENYALKEQNGLLKMENDNLKFELLDLRDDSIRVRNELEVVKMEGREVKEMLDVVKQDGEEARVEMNVVKSESREVRGMMEQIQKESINVWKELDSLKGENLKLRADIAFLKEEIDRLKVEGTEFQQKMKLEMEEMRQMVRRLGARSGIRVGPNATEKFPPPTRRMLELVKNTHVPQLFHQAPLTMCSPIGEWILKPAVDPSSQAHHQEWKDLILEDAWSGAASSPVLLPAALGGWLLVGWLHKNSKMATIEAKLLMPDLPYNQDCKLPLQFQLKVILDGYLKGTKTLITEKGVWLTPVTVKLEDFDPVKIPHINFSFVPVDVESTAPK